MQKPKLDLKELIGKYNKNFTDFSPSGEFIVDNYAKIMIETTNNCNFHCCTFCGHSKMERKRGFISFNLYKKIVKEAADIGFKNIDLRVYGEPLVDVKLEEKAKFAKEKGFKSIMISTNGEILTKQRFEQLVKSGINEINFSITPKREFEITRPGKSFDKIWKNLREVSTSKFRNVVVVWVIVTKGTTDKELRAFEKDVRALGYKNINYTAQTRIPVDINNGTADVMNHNITCMGLFRGLTVYWDGSIAMCPVDYNNKIKLGNLNDNSLADLINSEEFKEIRRNHLNFNYLDLCQRCDNPLDTFYEIFKDDHDLSELNYPEKATEEKSMMGF